ncbi:DNA-binding protein [Tychonema sp. BBK16]|uniref:helix-turn-helix domain-containing transcriptional regulator n=1 Tax=Tychonema sp. BBK16 TaxID=2699888 RepID=UPI001F32A806|nr:transcriptional regulator [Tychonema sp. BBK16]MCF6374074.1 transcriptional regulator [Tychonema sp. BBK16]
MNNVKMSRSDSYREYLIESLKDPEESAGYLEAILEEKDAEPELLRNAIRKVIEARIRMNALSDAAKHYHERLDKMLTASSGSEIYCFVELLEALGFKLEISVEDSELGAESESMIEESNLSRETANL